MMEELLLNDSSVDVAEWILQIQRQRLAARLDKPIWREITKASGGNQKGNSDAL